MNTYRTWLGISNRECLIKSDTPHDAPRTPYQRLLDSAILTGEQAAELNAVRAELNPADLTRRINAIPTQLIDHARTKTLALRDVS